MLEKPTRLSSRYAEPFQDKSVVAAYRHRPPYPEGRITLEVVTNIVWGLPGG